MGIGCVRDNSTALRVGQEYITSSNYCEYRRLHSDEISVSVLMLPLPMASREFKPGFRISAIDIIVLMLGAAGSTLVAMTLPWLGLAIGFTVGPFFLFCNVVRMSRPLELVWAALFVVLSALTILVDLPGWPITFVVSLIATIVLISRQTRKPSYHGIFWRQINPDLPQWWKENATA